MTINQQYPVSALAHKRSLAGKGFKPLLTQAREFEQLLQEVQSALSDRKFGQENWRDLKLRISQSLIKQPIQ